MKVDETKDGNAYVGVAVITIVIAAATAVAFKIRTKIQNRKNETE